MTALLLALLVAAPVGELAEKIEAQLEAWDVEGASRVLDELVHAHPGSPEALYFRGRVLFEQGHYDEAVKAYAQAQERGAGAGGFEGAIENDARLARNAAEETKGDESFESEHFVLKTRPGKDTLLAPYALAPSLRDILGALVLMVGEEFAHRRIVKIGQREVEAPGHEGKLVGNLAIRRDDHLHVAIFAERARFQKAVE